MADKEAGLEKRFEVKKISDTAGKHDECRYFVLDPQHDGIALVALGVYSIVARRNGYFALADELDRWIHSLVEGGDPS